MMMRLSVSRKQPDRLTDEPFFPSTMEDFKYRKFVTFIVTLSGRLYDSLAEEQNVVYNQTIPGNLGHRNYSLYCFFPKRLFGYSLEYDPWFNIDWFDFCARAAGTMQVGQPAGTPGNTRDKDTLIV